MRWLPLLGVFVLLALAATVVDVMSQAQVLTLTPGPRKVVLYADEPPCAGKRQVYLVTSRSHMLRSMPHPAETVWMCVE